MISAELNESHVSRFNSKLEKLAAQIRNPIEANRQASIAIYGAVIRSFDDENAAFGGWTPLAPRTVREKARIGKEKPMVRSGHLRGGFVPDHDNNNARVSNAVEYAHAHQFGVPERNLPPRNMLLNRAAILDIGIRVYGKYVEKITREANA